MYARAVTVDAILSSRLDALWRAFEAPGEKDEVVALGSMLALAEDPRLVVCDPNLAASAQPLERRLLPASWAITTLRRGTFVVAARAECSLHGRWIADGALEEAGDRPWCFARKGAVWSIRRERNVVHETEQTAGRDPVSRTKAHRSEAAALKAMRARLKSRIQGAMQPASPGPPAAWELARFEGGASDFIVDYGVAAFTDTQGLRDLRRSERLRERVAHGVQGPPGHRMFEAGRAWCMLSVFPSGRGDGRYRCYWGLSADGTATSLIVDLDPAPSSASGVLPSF